MRLNIIFERLGFGKNACGVYSALLESKNPLLVAEIASGIKKDRPEVYRNLKRLLKHQFIKKIIAGKRTFYSAENPRRISERFEDFSRKTNSLTEKLAKKTERALPEHIRYFKGFQGVRAVFDDAIEHTPKGERFYRYTSERDLVATNRYLSTDYRAKRDMKKLERLVISNQISGKQKRPRLERFIKFIPQEFDLFQQNIIQLIYSDYLAFINLNTEEAFIIKDPALASFQKVIFNQLYKRL